MSKQSVKEYLKYGTFDVENKPELKRAILTRLGRLGVDAECIAAINRRCICMWIDGSARFTSVTSAKEVAKNRDLLTLSDLYDIPETHTISIDGGKTVELSQESYYNLKESV